MKKLLILLCVLTLPIAADNTIKIGNHKWLTEENSIEEITTIALKNNKPILAVFSATWCGPCQIMKHDVFKKDEFKAVAEKVNLLYIEQTSKKSVPYLKKYSIRSYPTVMLLDKKGEILNRTLEDRSVKGILKWIEKEASSVSKAELEQKLQNDPENPELILSLTKKLGLFDFDGKINLLNKLFKKNIQIEKTMKTEAASLLLENMYYKYQGIENKTHIEESDTFAKAKLYPLLKDNQYLNKIIMWENLNQRYEHCIQIFESNRNDVTFKDYPELYVHVLDSYLKLGSIKEANTISDYAMNSILDGTTHDETPVWYSLCALNQMCIFNISQSKNKVESEKAVSQVQNYINKLESGHILTVDNRRYADNILDDYAKDYGINLGEYFKKLETQFNSKKLTDAILARLEKAELTLKHKDKKHGKELLLGYTKDMKFLNLLNTSQKSEFMNSIAWILYEQKMVDEQALEIADESVLLEKNAANLDTLACIHSELGNYNKAVNYEKEGLALLKDNQNQQKNDYKKNIEKWGALIHKD